MNISLWLRQTFCNHDIKVSEEEHSIAHYSYNMKYIGTTKEIYHVVSCRKCGMRHEKKI